MQTKRMVVAIAMAYPISFAAHAQTAAVPSTLPLPTAQTWWPLPTFP
jgi:hypothetical protein